MKRIFLCFLFASLVVFPVVSLDIPVAEFFQLVSESYDAVEDYIADLTIVEDEETMSGVVSYKKTNLMRIDFEDPEGMVITSDGQYLSVYVPLYRVVMVQELNYSSNSSSSGASFSSSDGLSLLKDNYSLSYLSSPEPTPLDLQVEEGVPQEMVIQLKLTRRTTNEDYRQLDISVDQNNMIRRIVGITADYRTIQFDFKNYQINTSIPRSRFELDTQNDANVYYNFLFDPDE